MRILFVGPRFHTNQYQMIKTLLENKHEVFFHVASYGQTEDYSLVRPVLFRQSRLSLLLEKMLGGGGVCRPRYFPNPVLYWQAFKKQRLDLVVIRDPYRIFSLIAALCALIAHTKIVFYNQEDLYRNRSWKTKIKQGFFLWFFKAAWMTPKTGNKQAKGGKLKHMYYVPLPIQVNPVAQINQEENGEGLPKILMVGKYHQERKKHLLFLEALSRLKEKYRFKATIVGECTREKQLEKFRLLQQTLPQLGLSGIVDLKRNVPYREMPDLYAAHNVFVLPAIDELYGVSVVEALGYGLPAICTDTCGARFNITPGENGFVVKSGSLDALTAALETLISDGDRIRKMREHSLRYVQDQLSGDAFYQKFLFMLQERFKMRCLT